MERPGEGEQPPQQQPWGRLLRLGAEEGEPHVLLRKREWTIGRRRGCDLSFPGNKLVSGDHCKIIVDEKSGQVSLEDTSTNGTVINKLKVVKKQTCPLQTGDVIYLVYRKNEPEHNVAYLYESFHEKQGVTQDSFEANKENVFHVTKDTSGAGRGDDPQDPQVLPSPPATQVCFEEPQPSTSTSDLFPMASTSSMEPTSAGRGPPSSSGSRGADVSPKGCGPSVASDEVIIFPLALPAREGASFSLSEPKDQEDLEPVKKRVKADGEPALNLPLVTDPGGDPHSTLDVRAATVKPDKMEETLTCIICQDLLHDCVRCARRARGAADGAGLCVRPRTCCTTVSACSPVCTPSALPATRAGWSALPCAPPAAVQWSGSVKTTSSTTWWRHICCSTRTRGAARRTCAAWPPGTGSRRTCCSPRSGGPSLTRRGAPRTCWSCRTWTASPRMSVSRTSCADSAPSTAGRRGGPFPAQGPAVSQGHRRPLGMHHRRPPASRQPRTTCVPCKEATPYAPAASSPCPTGGRSASGTPASPPSSVPSACSPSATCTGAAPGPAASAAWPRSANSTWATGVWTGC
nr:E3 ubiquitin-protein ligase CHFR isoform X4 [Globicephala melas]